MARSRFVQPDSIVLKISDGDTLTVRRRLNAGEKRAMFARMYLAGIDGMLRTNPLETGRALVIAYLLDWSLTDAAGALVPIDGLSPDELGRVIDSLDPEDFTEVKEAIEAHVVAMDEQRAQEKKQSDGRTGDEPGSVLPFAVAGNPSGLIS